MSFTRLLAFVPCSFVSLQLLNMCLLSLRACWFAFLRWSLTFLLALILYLLAAILFAVGH